MSDQSKNPIGFERRYSASASIVPPAQSPFALQVTRPDVESLIGELAAVEAEIAPLELKRNDLQRRLFLAYRDPSPIETMPDGTLTGRPAAPEVWT